MAGPYLPFDCLFDDDQAEFIDERYFTPIKSRNDKLTAAEMRELVFEDDDLVNRLGYFLRSTKFRT